jgi:hypothetical protein
MRLEVRDTALHSVQQRVVILFKRRVSEMQTSLHYKFQKKVLSSGPGNTTAGSTRTEKNTSHNRENTGIAYSYKKRKKFSCEHLFEINKKICVYYCSVVLLKENILSTGDC